MDDLSQVERRMLLTALARYRHDLGKTFDAARIDGNDDAGAVTHEIRMFDLVDGLVRKLGGDPAKEDAGAADV